MSKKKFNYLDYPEEIPQSKTISVEPSYVAAKNIPDSDIETITCRIESTATDITSGYENWRNLAFALADELGEQGREYFHRLSRFHNDYDYPEADKQYSACLNAHGSGITISTFYHLAQQAGVNVATATQTPNPSILLNSPKGEIKDIGVIGEIQQEAMPTFSPIIKDQLPNFFKQIIQKTKSDEEQDLLLLGSIVVLSSCLPNIYGVYDQNTIYPPLFLFVTAQAGGGKGRLKFCRNLVLPIHKEKKERSAAAYAKYQFDYDDCIKAKKRGELVEVPQEPPRETLFIPANSSSTSFYQVLSENNGEGLMFETEGDTLANTFNNDYGDYSDGFRKAFHHEPISYNRRKERESVEIESPKLTTLLSGTPQQIQTLIRSVENGLFSRFMFYYLNTNTEWTNVFANSKSGALDSYFDQLGERFYQFYKILNASKPICYTFTESQQNQFNDEFAKSQKVYLNLCGLGMLGSIRRLGVITFRVAMVLSTLRMIDNSQIPETLECNETDFHSAMEIVKVLFEHTANVYDTLPRPQQPTSNFKNERVKKFYEGLPQEFDRKTYMLVATQLGIPEKTAEKQIEGFLKADVLTRPAHGKYAKPQ